MPAFYRIGQFAQAVTASIREQGDEGSPVADCLEPEAASLFWAMPRYDRHHALKVFRTLQHQGHEEPDLLAAALLHDVGKTAHPGPSPRLGHRVAVVLMRALVPGLLERIVSGDSGGWRRAFHYQLHHAEIGAVLAQEAGCSARTAELIRLHEEHSEPTADPLLVALRSADSAS
jgi:hypothetical protein